jgi:hypothetical protein
VEYFLRPLHLAGFDLTHREAWGRSRRVRVRSRIGSKKEKERVIADTILPTTAHIRNSATSEGHEEIKWFDNEE